VRTRTGLFGMGVMLLVIGFYFASIVDEPSQCSDSEKVDECADLMKTRLDIATYGNFLGILFILSAIFLAIGDLQSK
jgi:hypothetical protein